MSIKHNDEIFLAPSGVQKERIMPDDLFVVDRTGQVIRQPAQHKKLKMSECTPLFMAAYELRDAGAVIHSHSLNANLVTLCTSGNEFKITHQEMIKGIKKGKYAVHCNPSASKLFLSFMTQMSHKGGITPRQEG